MRFKTSGHAANELYLHMMSLPYRKRIDIIQMRLARQKAAPRGTYSRSKAVAAFMPLVRAAARDMVREDRREGVDTVFDDASLATAAESQADRFERNYYPGLFERVLDERRAVAKAKSRERGR